MCDSTRPCVNLPAPCHCPPLQALTEGDVKALEEFYKRKFAAAEVPEPAAPVPAPTQAAGAVADADADQADDDEAAETKVGGCAARAVVLARQLRACCPRATLTPLTAHPRFAGVPQGQVPGQLEDARRGAHHTAAGLVVWQRIRRMM